MAEEWESFVEEEGDDEEEEEILTPAELIHKLEEAWLNEKFSPDLLDCKSEIVECVMEQLNHMEKNLQRAKKGDLKITIHRMEMERIRYVLSSYLRSRLQKIEKFFPHILEKEKSRLETEPSCLSEQEAAFAKEYATNCEAHLKNLALKRMPPNLQALDMLKAGHKFIRHPCCGPLLDVQDADFYKAGSVCSMTAGLIPKPNMDSFVFLRVKEKQENVLVEPETQDQREYTVDLEEGSQHLMRYRTIAPLVASGAVQLI